MPLSVTLREGVFHLTGALDEFSDFAALRAAPRPLKLDLSGVSRVNSLGASLYLDFIRVYADALMELHACSEVFIDLINTFPGMLGTPPQPQIVKSLMVGYQCGGCLRQSTVLIVQKDFVRSRHRFPSQVCSKCGLVAASTLSAADVLTFLFHPE